MSTSFTQYTAELPAGPGLVAFSGGPDSTFLALVLAERGKRPVLAHLDHALRGDHLVEAEWVRRFARRHGLRLIQQALEPGALRGPSIEASARRARYRFLAEAAHQTGAAWVATGHTADDQAETLLLRLHRGAGLRGMGGIATARPLVRGSPVRLVRPLLGFRRDEIRQSLAAAGEAWYEDPSNVEPVFARNRLRRELLPRVAHLVDRMARLAAASEALAGHCRAEAARLLGQAELGRSLDLLGHAPVELFGEGARLLEREALRRAPPALLDWILEQAFDAPQPLLERVHLAQFRTLLAAGAGRTLCLPQGWRALFEADWVGLARRAPEPLPALQPRPLVPPAELSLAPLPLVLVARLGVPESPGEAHLRLPAGEWLVRGRHPGDRLRRAAGARDVRRLQADLGIPAFLRPAWPLLVEGRRVLWMHGAGVDRDAAPRAGEPGVVLRLTIDQSSARSAAGSRSSVAQ